MSVVKSRLWSKPGTGVKAQELAAGGRGKKGREAWSEVLRYLACRVKKCRYFLETVKKNECVDHVIV